MRMYDIIKRKRDGEELTDDEIRFFIKGCTEGSIPDYQAAALLMAIWFRGMSTRETVTLTLAIRDSGETLTLPSFKGLRVDKHSTGGVGDKTSLVIAPVVAALGLPVAKMSGRGLGHTGGTVDKLEAFEGLSTSLSPSVFAETVKRCGISIVGQSATLAPADKLLYALRDVTATVDSLPLIASSIMGKKLAANDDCIVLDVKVGSGAFLKTEQEARDLAQLMVNIGERAGKRMCALITDMDAPLGNAVGNSLEVIEAIETLSGKGPDDLNRLCTALAGHMLTLAGKGSYENCTEKVSRVLQSGEALQKLADMVEAQGGDPAWVHDTARFPSAKHSCTVTAEADGYIARVDAEAYGRAALVLGAGRNTKDDVIDMTAGIRIHKKTGAHVEKGEPIATLYTTAKPQMLKTAAEILADATQITREQPTPRPLIIDVIYNK